MHRGMDATVRNTEVPAIDLRTAAVRVVDSLIPVVQRSAGPMAVLRDTRLMVGVTSEGTLIARLVHPAR